MRGSDLRRGDAHPHPFVMGILNVTPDSFSDGGLFTDTEAAVRHAFRMIDDGAEIIDIGAESTRPGFTPVPAEEEIRRLIPVIERLSESSDVPISVDTMKPEAASAAVSAGADIINDVNALRAPGMAELAAETGVPVVIMHMPGDPASVHDQCMEGHVIPAVRAFLSERIESLISSGVRRDNIIIDPGVGFGKTMEQNIELVEHMDQLDLGVPVLAGLSRKRFLAVMYPGMDRDEATVSASLKAAEKGADILRVHDVRRMCQAFRT